MFQHNVIVYDDRLNLNPNSFQIRPVYHPANEEYYDVPNVITGDDDDDDTDSNSNSDDNYLYKTDSAYDFGNDNSGGVYDFGNSRQRRGLCLVRTFLFSKTTMSMPLCAIDGVEMETPNCWNTIEHPVVINCSQ